MIMLIQIILWICQEIQIHHKTNNVFGTCFDVGLTEDALKKIILNGIVQTAQ